MQRYAMVATENGEELQTDIKGELIRIKDLIAWLDAQGDAAMEQVRTLQEGTDEHSTMGNVVQHFRFVSTSLRLEFGDDSEAASMSPALSGHRLSSEAEPTTGYADHGHGCASLTSADKQGE